MLLYNACGPLDIPLNNQMTNQAEFNQPYNEPALSSENTPLK